MILVGFFILNHEAPKDRKEKISRLCRGRSVTGKSSASSMESSSRSGKNDYQEAYHQNFLRDLRGLCGSIFNLATNAVKSGNFCIKKIFL
jgi:hypothetical protein